VQVEKPRQFASRILLRHQKGAEFIEEIFDEVIAGAGLKPVDRALVQEIAYGCVRWQAVLDYFMDKLTNGRTQPPPMRVLLRMGIYQSLMLDRVPGHALVNESVNLARLMGLEPHTGFVNAVLRTCERDREKLLAEWQSLKQAQPAVGWSHPKWLVERWEQRLSKDELLALLEWNNQPPSVFARLNPLRTLPEATIESWRADGLGYHFRSYDWVPENLVFELKSVPSVTHLPGFQKGAFYIQDPSTLLAVKLLDPQPGERILDLCAAPGGKTTYIAQVIDDDGEIAASDIDAERLKLVTENCKRMHITSVSTYQAEELENYRRNGGEPFDRVLVDAPCSNTGVIRRRVDLRWRLRATEFARLRKLQLELLHRATSLLKPGGVLVYSTCSLEPEENEQLIRAFLEDYPLFDLETERTLFPPRDKVDGAYVARLRRKS
jgi:16S rRNA (cytosine967-C5)-methyltransferase